MAATAASSSHPPSEAVAGRLETEAAGALLSELFARHASTVVGVCRGMLRHREDAEDAAQQVFLSAYRALLGGTTPREPAGWLATIARNECRRRIAEHMRTGIPIGTVEETLADQTVRAAPANAAALREAVADLPPMQQRALLLREFAGLSYDEVADALAISERAVDSLLVRARRRLQARLRPALAALGIGPIPVLREALARLVPGFAVSSGGGLATAGSVPVAAKVAAGVASVGLVAGGTVVAVEADKGVRSRAPRTVVTARSGVARPIATRTGPPRLLASPSPTDRSARRRAIAARPRAPTMPWNAAPAPIENAVVAAVRHAPPADAHGAPSGPDDAAGVSAPPPPPLPTPRPVVPAPVASEHEPPPAEEETEDPQTPTDDERAGSVEKADDHDHGDTPEDGEEPHDHGEVTAPAEDDHDHADTAVAEEDEHEHPEDAGTPVETEDDHEHADTSGTSGASGSEPEHEHESTEGTSGSDTSDSHDHDD